ncbi:MAG: hypothetical protein RR497_04465 [Oscillospiraceae bacterium]
MNNDNHSNKTGSDTTPSSPTKNADEIVKLYRKTHTSKINTTQTDTLTDEEELLILSSLYYNDH